MSTIYHYTTASALIGMLSECTMENHKNLKMWATHAEFLNDPSEYEYGKTASQKILQEVETILNIPEEDRLSSTMYEDSKKQYFVECERGITRFTDSLYMAPPFVISFSKNRDLLPMWTLYGKNGSGIAIGFNRELLEKNNNNFAVKDCFYGIDVTDYTALINLIKYWYEMMLQKINGATHVYTRVCQIELIMSINTHVSAYIKHESYRYEQEVRYRPYRVDDSIKFRESNGLIVPYVEVNLPVDSIEEIVIGPTLDAERMKLSIELLLKTKGIYNDIEIKESDIPYRG